MRKSLKEVNFLINFNFCDNILFEQFIACNGVVLLNNRDYGNSVEQLFKDQIKFKIFDKDPTITRTTNLQNYLRNVCHRGEISKADFDQVRLKNEKPAKSHDFPKTHKTFTNTLKFRPIIGNHQT